MYSPLVAGADIIVVRDAHWAIVTALPWVAAQGARNGADAAARVNVQPLCARHQSGSDACPRQTVCLPASQLSLVIISRLSFISQLRDE